MPTTPVRWMSSGYAAVVIPTATSTSVWIGLLKQRRPGHKPGGEGKRRTLDVDSRLWRGLFFWGWLFYIDGVDRRPHHAVVAGAFLLGMVVLQALRTSMELQFDVAGAFLLGMVVLRRRVERRRGRAEVAGAFLLGMVVLPTGSTRCAACSSAWPGLFFWGWLFYRPARRTRSTATRCGRGFSSGDGCSTTALCVESSFLWWPGLFFWGWLFYMVA